MNVSARGELASLDCRRGGPLRAGANSMVEEPFFLGGGADETLFSCSRRRSEGRDGHGGCKRPSAIVVNQ